MNVLLTTLNAKFIHKNLALRYLYQTQPKGKYNVTLKEFTIKDSTENIVKQIVELEPDVIGMSTYIWNVEQIKEVLVEVKKRLPDVKIQMGGPEVSFEPEYFLEEFATDAISCGEGEFTFWQYVEHCHEEVFDIPGIFTRTCKPTIGYSIVDLKEVEKYENPYFLEMDMKDMGNRYLYVETSRGCPYCCSYCLSSVLGKVRLFSVDYIKRVLDQVFASDVKQVKFLDRTFNVDKNRALELAKYIDAHAKEDQSFEFEIMAEALSEELLDYLEHRQSKPKFRYEIGIQSLNQEALKEIHRYQNFDRLKAVVERLGKNNNCEMHVDLIAGLPFEDLESFKHSFNEVFYLHAKELQLGFLKLLRGTLLKDHHEMYDMEYDPHAPYEIFETKWMSKEDINEIHICCYALDVLYNKPRLRRTIDMLVHDYHLQPFDVFTTLGRDLYAHKYNQIDLIMKSVIHTVKEYYHMDIVGSCNEEYYRLFKNKTKRLVPYTLDESMRDKYLEMLYNANVGSMNDLINYGIFAKGKEGELFILYSSKQSYPKLYVINEVVEEIK